VLTSLVTAEPVVPEYVGSWLGYAIVAIPWLIYVHRSQRVRETFVNPLWWAVAGFR
jgi:hypothetical protein